MAVSCPVLQFGKCLKQKKVFSIVLSEISYIEEPPINGRVNLSKVVFQKTLKREILFSSKDKKEFLILISQYLLWQRKGIPNVRFRSPSFVAFSPYQWFGLK